LICSQPKFKVLRRTNLCNILLPLVVPQRTQPQNSKMRTYHDHTFTEKDLFCRINKALCMLYLYQRIHCFVLLSLIDRESVVMCAVQTEKKRKKSRETKS
jgi:hypothetical protein